MVDWRQNGIPQLMMEFWIKQRKNEPLIVLTHSMEGQIVYDLVTHFLPRLNRICGIDSWYATASQVDLFEEMKLFLESSDAARASIGYAFMARVCRRRRSMAILLTSPAGNELYFPVVSTTLPVDLRCRSRSIACGTSLRSKCCET